MTGRSGQRQTGKGGGWRRVLSAATFVALVCLIVVPAAVAKVVSSGTMRINGGVKYANVSPVIINSSVSGVTQMRFSNAGGSYTAWEPYNAIKVWTLPAGEGLKTVSGQYKSKGKAITKTASIDVDTTAPALATLTTSSHPVEATWYGATDVTLDWTAAVDASGIAGYSWVLDGDAATDPDAVSEGPSTTTTLTGVVDGAWYFHVRARDTAGNWGATIHRTVRIDTTAPATADNSDGLPHVLFTLTFSPGDELSGVVATEFRIDGGAWKAGARVTVRRMIKHKLGDLTRGAHSVDYRSIDAAGNIEPFKTCSVTIE